MKYLKLYESFINLIKESVDDLSQFGFTEEDLTKLKEISEIKPQYQVLGDGNSPDLYYQTKEFDNYFKSNLNKFKNFFESKNIPIPVIDYWFRPEGVEHQEWIQIALAFSEIVLDNQFQYEFVDFDPNLIKGDDSHLMWEVDSGRRYKLYSFLMKGGYEWKTERTKEEDEMLSKSDVKVKDAPNSIEMDTTQLKGGIQNDLITCDKEKAGSNWNNGYWLGDKSDYSKLTTPEEREQKMLDMTKSFVTSGDQSKKPIVIYKATKGNETGKYLILDGGHRVFLCQWLNSVHGLNYKLKAIVFYS